MHTKRASPVRHSGSVLFSRINGPFVDQQQCNKIEPGNGREISLCRRVLPLAERLKINSCLSYNFNNLTSKLRVLNS